MFAQLNGRFSCIFSSQSLRNILRHWHHNSNQWRQSQGWQHMVPYRHTCPCPTIPYIYIVHSILFYHISSTPQQSSQNPLYAGWGMKSVTRVYNLHFWPLSSQLTTLIFECRSCQGGDGDKIKYECNKFMACRWSMYLVTDLVNWMLNYDNADSLSFEL